jgi:hypothetical protein
MSEIDFKTAILHARSALAASERLPGGPYRRFAIDDLRSAVSWLNQAHDEWAQREANK